LSSGAAGYPTPENQKCRLAAAPALSSLHPALSTKVSVFRYFPVFLDPVQPQIILLAMLQDRRIFAASWGKPENRFAMIPSTLVTESASH
jgi:hypothetical protein